MHYGRDVFVGKDPVQELPVADVTVVELGFLGNRLTVPRGQVVSNDHVFALFYQSFNHVRTDVAGPTCNKNCHNAISLSLSKILVNKPVSKL